MIATTDKLQVLVTQQGDAVCGEGYGLKLQENIAAFWLDGWGETGRIYWSSYCNNAFIDGEIINCPEITIEDGREDSSWTVICFPEFRGWRVHCLGGGKSMSVCLTKD